MRASVIIPTRNRANVLAGCLDSLARQSMPRDAFEVLVVDNGSSDGTQAVADQYARQLQLEYIFVAEPGLHVARHEGMRRARSDVLMFADDDIQAGSGWVEAVTSAFADDNVGLVGGNDLPLFEAPPPLWLEKWWNQPVGRGRALGHLSILDFGSGRFDIDPGFVWGCNFSVRRSALLAAGGFHPDALPADRLRLRGDGETHVSNEIRKSGTRALFDAEASVHHRVPSSRMTPDYFVRRAYAQGVSHSYSVIRRHGGLQEPVGFGTRQFLRRLGSSASAGVKAAFADGDPAIRELESIQKATTAAFWEGYRFHQLETRADPSLLAWVLQEDYR